MKNIFNFKLYLEGLKKIRLVGIIVGIIVAGGTMLPPLVALLDDSPASTVSVIDASDFAIPLILILFLTPFFFLSMFSYLNKRNESDFYHSIPYKRNCVQISFMAAIFTWIWGIILVALLAAGFLWMLCPTTTFSVSTIPLLFVIYAATSVYIGGFIMLAMTLSGTVISNITVAFILMFSFRILGFLVSVTLEEMVPMFDIAYSPARFFSFKYWLPTAVITSFYDTTVFQSVSLWVYSAVVTVGIYALSLVCYRKRKSEMAGRSAPGKIMQHVYRCAFTLPFALLIAIAIMMDEDISMIIVLLLLMLGVYYIYELIMSKNLKSALRATPYLLVLVACGALFSAGCYATTNYVYSTEYEADDIKTVRLYKYDSIYDLFDTSTDCFEDLVTGDVAVPNEAARQIVAKALSDSIEYETTQSYYHLDTTRVNIEITLASGRKIGRRIRILSEDYKQLMTAFSSSSEYKQAYIQLPSKNSIQRVYISTGQDVEQDDLMRLWETFEKEYNALTEDEKIAYKNQYSSASNGYYIGNDSVVIVGEDISYGESLLLNINVYGVYAAQKEYYASYTIPESFTETRAMYFKLLEETQNKMLETLNEFIQTDYDSFVLEGEEVYWGNFSYYLTSDSHSHYYDYYYQPADPTGETEFTRAQEILRILLPHLTATPDSAHCYCSFNFSWDTENDYFYQNTVFGLTPFSASELRELAQLVNGENFTQTPDVLIDELSLFTSGKYDIFFEEEGEQFRVTFETEDFVYTVSDKNFGTEDAVTTDLQTAQTIVDALQSCLSFNDEGNQTCTVLLQVRASAYDDFSTYRYEFAWEKPDEALQEKLDALLSASAS